MLIRKLKEKEEKNKTRKLWEHAFPEDSRKFVDYYYKEKCRDNCIWVLEERQEIYSMVHLNPYLFQITPFVKDKETRIYYIVGVSTKEERRKRGYMDRLLQKALNSMKEEGIPFTFLMPAREEIYLPYDFRYIYDKEEYTCLVMPTFQSLKNEMNGMALNVYQGEEYELADINKAGELADFAAEILKQRYTMYASRNEDYYKRWIKELKAQDGGISIFREDKEIKSYYAFGQDGNKIEIQEVLKKDISLSQMGLQKNKTKPLIMARILNINKIAPFIRAKTPFSLKIYIKDSVIKENNGLFLWEVGRKGSFFKKLGGGAIQAAELFEEGNPDWTVSIGELGQFIFGYKSVSHWMKRGEISEKTSKMLEEICLLSPIFMNEIV